MDLHAGQIQAFSIQGTCFPLPHHQALSDGPFANMNRRDADHDDLGFAKRGRRYAQALKYSARDH
jgi:hypothetical protein